MKLNILRAVLACSVSALLAGVALASYPSNLQLDKSQAQTDGIVSFSVDSRYESDYISDNGVSYDSAIWRTDLLAKFKGGFRVGAAVIRGIDADDPYADELKLHLEQEFKFCDFYYALLGYRYEVIHGPWDLSIPYAEVGRVFELTPDISMSLYMRGEYWHNIQDQTDDNGLIPEIGARFLTKLSPRFKLDLRFSAVYDPGIQGGNAGFVGWAEGYVNYDVDSEGVTQIYTGGKISQPWTDGTVDMRKQNRAWELGVRVNDIEKAGSQVKKLFANE